MQCDINKRLKQCMRHACEVRILRLPPRNSSGLEARMSMVMCLRKSRDTDV